MMSTTQNQNPGTTLIHMKTNKTNLKSIATALCALVLLVTIGTGCRNTAHGVGQDIERAGEKIQEKTD